MIGGSYSIDDIIEIAFQHTLQVMEGQANAMIGNPPLGIIISANFF